VLGLNVDHDKPKLTKAYKKRLEGHLRGISEFSAIEHSKHKNFHSVYSMLDHVLGLINHARTVDEEYAIKMLDIYRTEIHKQGFQ
jgi:RNA-directed DNA polymerase